MNSPANRLWPIVKTGLLAVAALAAVGLFLAWMGGAFHSKVLPGAIPVERPSASGRNVVPVERQHVDDAIEAVGSVQPRKRTDVASQLLATIREINVRPGDRVTAGKVLVVLDDRELLAQQREATAALSASEADLLTRKGDFERARTGLRTGVVTREDHDRFAGAVKVSEAQVQRAKEQIARLEVQFTYTRIASGTGGLVADRLAEPGDVAVPGKPILSVYDPGDLELHAAVPESMAAGIGVGQKLRVRVDAAGINALGEVREVVPMAQQASRTVLVKVGLTSATASPALPGMFGRIAVPIGRTVRLVIPRSAVRTVGQLELVDVVDPDGHLTRRFVRTGRPMNGNVEVLSGLSEGEQVALPTRD
jgi:RND family efflux transporter MFP subunit